MLSDITIVAIVFALILLVVFFSAVVLYLAFRIKEAFRKETRRGATVAKVAFLIGILFLAGGIFYFAANSLANSESPPEPSPSSSPSPISSSSIMPSVSPTPSSPTASSSGTPNATTQPSFTSNPGTFLSLSVAYPPTAKMNSTITITFTITNPSLETAHSAVLETNSLFQIFQLELSTKPIIGNVINVGDVPQGTTIVTLQLLSPKQSRNFNDTITLIYQEATSKITQSINISIRGN